jgi:hypothetical protein
MLVNARFVGGELNVLSELSTLTEPSTSPVATKPHP